MGYDVICKSLFVLSRKRASLHLHLLNNPLLPTDLKCNNNMFTEYLKIFFIYLAVHILWYAGSSFLMRDWTWAPCIGSSESSHWIIREVPLSTFIFGSWGKIHFSVRFEKLLLKQSIWMLILYIKSNCASYILFSPAVEIFWLLCLFYFILFFVEKSLSFLVFYWNIIALQCCVLVVLDCN